MKITIQLKDPDTMYDAVNDAVADDLASDMPDDERKALHEIRTDKIRDKLSKWFECGEYLTVEYDTEADTLTVVERS